MSGQLPSSLTALIVVKVTPLIDQTWLETFHLILMNMSDKFLLDWDVDVGVYLLETWTRSAFSCNEWRVVPKDKDMDKKDM